MYTDLQDIMAALQRVESGDFSDLDMEIARTVVAMAEDEKDEKGQCVDGPEHISFTG